MVVDSGDRHARTVQGLRLRRYRHAASIGARGHLFATVLIWAILLGLARDNAVTDAERAVLSEGLALD